MMSDDEWTEALDLLREAPASQLDASVRPMIEQWASPPQALQVLEVLDRCVSASLASGFMVRFLDIIYNDALRREGTTHDEVTKGGDMKVIVERRCDFCGAAGVDAYKNYCNWDCIIGKAKQQGGKIYTPNGLPIKSVKLDSTMLEHEHGDHPDYKFPVEVEYVGPIVESDAEDYRICVGSPHTSEDELRRFRDQTHALIYTDGFVAVTLYECCYAMWWVIKNGESLGGNMWERREWKLTEKSVKDILQEKLCN